MKTGVFFDHLRVASDQLGLSLDDVAKEAAALGISFVHVNTDFWMANEARVDTLLEKTGLTAGAADLFVELTQGRDMDKAEQAIRFLSRKGTPHLLLIPGFVHEAQTRQSAMDQAAVHLKELVYLAHSFHVQCSLEDFDNDSAPYGTWQELKWYMEHVPGLGVTLDTGNFAYFGQNVLEACDELQKHICMVHAKDRRIAGREGEKPLHTPGGRQLYPSAVGGGIIPMQAIVEKLKAQGYDGGIIIEHFDSAEMLEDMRRSAAWLKKHWQ